MTKTIKLIVPGSVYNIVDEPGASNKYNVLSKLKVQKLKNCTISCQDAVQDVCGEHWSLPRINNQHENERLLLFDFLSSFFRPRKNSQKIVKSLKGTFWKTYSRPFLEDLL